MLRKHFSENKIGYVTFRITNTNLDLGIIRGYIYDSNYIFNDGERLSSAIVLLPPLEMITADVFLEVTDLYTQKLIIDMLCKIQNSIGYEFKIYCDLNISIWRFISSPSICHINNFRNAVKNNSNIIKKVRCNENVNT